MELEFLYNNLTYSIAQSHDPTISLRGINATNSIDGFYYDEKERINIGKRQVF